ncbi:carbamoyltransferase HypF [Sedimenticola thiotaurini]|uniref:Carbamoyltransferase HypF n=1 Tax=Sedimenticola thiotaurini TaxID=1543721 RepID=A0A0F7JXD3_9GAMM|nr:carbamoyltransferase HypF [Sedimenticola thiotaurini]AKH19455.1 carbamoyltransferase [Sedimenticola thiotaurini]
MSVKPYAERIRVRGLVQGVGFRPTVWNFANRCELLGAVWNDAQGVLIDAVGSKSAIDQLTDLIARHPPPLARIDGIERQPLPPGEQPDYTRFEIIESRGGDIHTGIVPDAATCSACLQDIDDPTNRRYRYPFTNCTHCGPRLSIVRAIPYDRATTSMGDFQQCDACLAEYGDPSDRRFHAQPNACPACGPQVWLENGAGERLPAEHDEDPIERAARLIASGAILAIKGLGGVHLACDAGNELVVAALRSRKRRYHKPFALMATDADMIRRYAHLNEQEVALLKSSAAPIVILQQGGEEMLAREVAPGQQSLGFMLPYTPLHHLLMGHLARPIVLTSGNLSDEPQVISNKASQERLAGIADYWLLHDREIVNRLDDSVVRVMDGDARMLRRARGYAPAPIVLPDGFEKTPAILALGGELKNTFCLLRDGQAIVSQHMGDLENSATMREYHRSLELYRQLYQLDPALVVVDYHPNYLSTQWGQQMASEQDLQLEAVQHHHAHIASCMAEHGLGPDHPAVLGVALDGLGMGESGSLWGGEFLRVNYCQFQRLAHFKPTAMLGGAKAMYEPWRNTLAYLLSEFEWETLLQEYGDLELIRFLNAKPIINLQQMWARGINSPLASSCGRLFDAVAAALNICREQASHEGQAAIEMEALAAPPMGQPGYGHRLELIEGRYVLGWQPLWSDLLDDLKRSVPVAIMAARFHQGIIDAVTRTALLLCQEQQLDTVVLSGGVFQNRILLEGVSDRLRQQGLNLLSPRLVPANDGGLSLGQAVVAAARWQNRPC